MIHQNYLNEIQKAYEHQLKVIDHKLIADVEKVEESGISKKLGVKNFKLGQKSDFL